MPSSPVLSATVLTRREQMAAYGDRRGVESAKAIVRAKLGNQATLLKYFGKYLKTADPADGPYAMPPAAGKRPAEIKGATCLAVITRCQRGASANRAERLRNRRGNRLSPRENGAILHM